MQAACELRTDASVEGEHFPPLTTLFSRLLPGLQRSFPFSPGLPRAAGVRPARAGSQGSPGSLVALVQLGHGAGHVSEMVFPTFLCREVTGGLGRMGSLLPWDGG